MALQYTVLPLAIQYSLLDHKEAPDIPGLNLYKVLKKEAKASNARYFIDYCIAPIDLQFAPV